MIRSLHISNYALIDVVDIDFTRGLNIITGETGAGKSIMLGALSLILGERADLQAVGDAQKKSVIEATFDVSELQYLKTWFDENDYDWEADNMVSLRREIVGSRSRAFINDTPVTLDRLQWLAARLVDIHSQHQNALLSDPDFQLDILDSLAGSAQLLQDYAKAYKQYKLSLKEYHETRRRILKSRTDEEFIRYQLEQLDDLDLQAGEKADLEREREEIANWAELKAEINMVNDSLSQGEANVIDLIDNVMAHIQSISHMFDEEDRIDERLENIRVELNDIADTVAGLSENVHGDVADLDAIDARLRRINELEERHSVTTEDELLAVRSRLQNQLDELDGADIVLSELEKNARKAKASAKELARQLSLSRQAQAEWLESELMHTARPLGMNNLKVQISVEPADLGPNGADRVDFKFAFNKNQQLLPVKGAASGGEISRLMLSLKSIIARTMSLPTIIFDEVDTGVSGDVANRMGLMMSQIAESLQVIAITHLPQVASKGVSHFKVFKSDDEHATHTYIRRLEYAERVDELALMLSGSTSNAAARQTAENLLTAKTK